MKIHDFTNVLEKIAPLSLQEDYDNSGLILGHKDQECTGVLISLDVTEKVIDEAMEKNCNLIISHHPLIFKGIKKLTTNQFTHKAIIKSIKNNIAVYASHTNLDNVSVGVNKKIAEKLQLQELKMLVPREDQLKKLITFAPLDKTEEIRKAIFDAGGGKLGNYSECSFTSYGEGSFKPEEGADPFIGQIGVRHVDKEMKIEVIFHSHLQQKITEAMLRAHPYEEVAFDIVSLNNFFSSVGSGMIGELTSPMDEMAFLKKLKDTFTLKVIRHSALQGKMITTVAVCGGAGIFLEREALKAGADIFITSDIKYHEFFETGEMVLADIGHYESEQFTTDLIFELLSAEFPNFAILKTGHNTNPVNYFL